MSDTERVSAAASNKVQLDSCSYTWSQTLKEVELSIAVPPGTRGKDMSITISKAKLSVGLKGKDVYFSGALSKEVHVDESTWTIDDQREVNIHLEKVNQEWWSSVVQGHPSIDVTKISPENSKLGDLDGDTRAMVEKMMVRVRQLPSQQDAHKTSSMIRDKRKWESQRAKNRRNKRCSRSFKPNIRKWTSRTQKCHESSLAPLQQCAA